MVTWRKTNDPDLIEWPPYFIRRYPEVGRYLLGRDEKKGAQCLGGFDTADEAKAACERIVNETKEAA